MVWGNDLCYRPASMFRDRKPQTVTEGGNSPVTARELELQMEVITAQGRIGRLEEEVEKERAARRGLVGLLAQERETRDKLIEEMIQLARRPPVQIPPVDPIPLVREIAAAILGWNKDQTEVNTTQAEEMGMDKQGLDNRGGVTDSEWFPDIEFDPFMDGKMPTRGGWVGSVPMNPTEDQTPVHSVVPGPLGDRVVRQDGSPMFGAGKGQWTPPHEGGIVE